MSGARDGLGPNPFSVMQLFTRVNKLGCSGRIADILSQIGKGKREGPNDETNKGIKQSPDSFVKS